MIRYATTATWEEFANDRLTETILTKQIALELRPQNGHYEMSLRTEAVALDTHEELQPLEQLTLRLAAVYQELVLQVTPTREPLALLNYEHIRAAWATLKKQLLAETTETDTFTQAVVRQVEAQVQDPQRLLHSLRHDYLYRTLLYSFRRPLYPAAQTSAQPVEFAQFYEDCSLWFSEHAEVSLAQAAARTRINCWGALHEGATDVSAVRQHINAALRPGRNTTPDAAKPEGKPPFRADVPAQALRGTYEASYEVEPASGLPWSAHLTVACAHADRYNKQYSLALHRL